MLLETCNSSRFAPSVCYWPLKAALSLVLQPSETWKQIRMIINDRHIHYVNYGNYILEIAMIQTIVLWQHISNLWHLRTIFWQWSLCFLLRLEDAWKAVPFLHLWTCSAILMKLSFGLMCHSEVIYGRLLLRCQLYGVCCNMLYT